MTDATRCAACGRGFELMETRMWRYDGPVHERCIKPSDSITGFSFTRFVQVKAND